MQSDSSHDRQSLSETPASRSVASNANANANPQRPDGKRVVKKSTQICRFYNTKKGCRAQDQCPYRHVQPSDDPTFSAASAQHKPDTALGVDTKPAAQDSQRATAPRQGQTGTRLRAAVSKPVPSLQQKDPREFQIGQIVRRFMPTREDSPNGTVLKLKLRPSDPDFPFELEALDCVLTVPLSFPQDGKPSVAVKNADMPRGFQINIERGFDSLVSGTSGKTLLQLLNDLDRNLERFLTSEKAQTIKIVANRRKENPLETTAAIAEQISNKPKPSVPSISAPSLPQWTSHEKQNAKEKRVTEIRQLEARMSRVPLFSKSSDGISFNVPLQIPKPSRLPLSLQSLKEATLIVPELYDLTACRVQLKGVSGTEVQLVETALEKHASEHREMTLMAHINFLTQNIHSMAAAAPTPVVSPSLPVDQPIGKAGPSAAHDSQVAQNVQEGIIDEDRPHLRFLSQPPPEWSHRAGDENETESESSDEYDSGSNESDVSDTPSHAGGASVPAQATSGVLEKGILISFPQLELHGIELLELRDISLTVKCDRCKETLDIKNIKPAEPNSTSIRTESCNKCASSVSVSYRPEPMHTNSIRAGYLDLEGCTVVDMLTSHFLPTCSECSTTQAAPGINSVRGESPIAVCRECHHRLNFKIPEVKFLRVSSNDPRLHLPLKSKRKKENLGITAGTELPDRGRCKHYAKSYRWFRFSCCNRVYPCDRCHDEKEEHPNEHANRMICGWCSREQNYRPEDCSACGRNITRRTGGGFWEGGKGTRDKNKMSRKDPRKFKRIGGGARGGEK